MDDLLSNISHLDNLSDDQLKQYASNPNSPLGIYALSVLQNRAIMRNQAQAAGAQQPQTTVRDSITASLPENSGIAAALGDQPVFTAAQGGIVAFDRGGDVTSQDIAYGNALDESFLGWMPRAGGAIASDILGLPGQFTWVRDPKTGKLYRRYEREGFMPRMSKFEESEAARREKGVKQFETTKRKEDTTRISASPSVTRANADIAQNALYGPSELDRLNATVPSMPQEEAKLTAPKPRATKSDSVAPAAGPALNLPPPVGIDSLYKPTVFDAAAYDEYASPVRELSAYAQEYKDYLGEDKGLAALKTKSEQMGANIEKQKELAPWMAAMRFGLGMAAGKSPFALQNVAEGGIEGMKDYASSIADYNKAQERKFDIDARLASAERAEQVSALNYGRDSRQADQANQRAVGLAKMSDKARVDLQNASQELEAKKFVIDDQRKREELKQDAAYKKALVSYYNRPPEEIRAAEAYAAKTGMSFKDAFNAIMAGKHPGSSGLDEDTILRTYNDGVKSGAIDPAVESYVQYKSRVLGGKTTDYTQWGNPTKVK